MPPKKRPSRGKAQGSAWRKVRKEVFSRQGTRCWICNHGGSTSVDHVEPLTERPDLALELSNLRPAHGYPNPCPACTSAAGQKVYCNEIRGAMSVERARRKIRELTGLTLGVNGDEEPGEREW